MNHNKLESLEKVHTKILHWGIFLNIFLPVALFFLTIIIREKLLVKHIMKNTEFLFYVLLAVSVTEILILLFLRKKLLQSFSKRKTENESNKTIEQNLFSYGIIIYSLCLAPIIYGLVYYLLGGIWERFALFIAITFLSFQLFRPRETDLEKLRMYSETD